MPVSNETILCYFPDPVLGSGAKKVFLAQGVRVKTAAPDQGGQSVGYLMGCKGCGESPDAPARPLPPEPVLVLDGFTGARMDALFAALRRAGLPRMGLKAVLTPTNRDWAFADLCAELAQERSAMGGPAVP